MKPSRLAPALVTAVILGAFGPGPAVAAQGPAAPPGAKAEIPGMSAADCDKQFVAFDGNRDGKLSFKEFAAGRYGRLRFVMAPSDADVKGFMARYTAIARAADKNRDGWLTRREHQATCNGDGP